MKTAIMTLALLCAGAALAQTPPQHAAAEARHMDNLATLLDLTDVQKPKVQEILEEQHAQMHAQMKDSFEQAKASGTRPDWQQMKALHEQLEQQTLQKLTAVPLSPIQLKKFQAIQQEMHSHMGHRMGHAEHGSPATPAAPAAQN
jgi:hypothetical protein